jgi:hypothetical protein
MDSCTYTYSKDCGKNESFVNQCENSFLHECYYVIFSM